jgi:signal transduction histidine kinase
VEDVHGNLWFGTFGGGVCKYDGETFMHYTENEGLSNDYVRSILEDRHGNLWFGTFGGGVCMYDGETFTHFTEKEGLSNNDVRTILEDSHGNLWFGTYGGGVCMYDGKTFTHFTEREGLSNNIVRSILEDNRGNLWFGTYGGGVSRYNGKTFTHFTEKEGLNNNRVMSIREDSHGNLWFGTGGGGVNMYDGDTFTYFTEKEGLSNNYIWSILEDSTSNIWLSTEKGLNRLVPGPDSFNVTSNNPAIYTYSLMDGLKAMDFYLNSVLLDSKNRIWWGSGKGLTMLNLKHFKTPVDPPSMQLNRVDVNEQFIDYRNFNDYAGIQLKYNAVAKFHNYPLSLEIPYKNNHLTFHYSAIDWSAPHKIWYSYKMEGLNNNNWSLPTSEAKADYRSLPYGTYTFTVRAIGGAQKWSEPFAYTFTINPPWWHSWWARAGYAVTALLIIFGYVRLRTAQLKQRQKELETEVANATLKIRAQKEEVETQRDEIEAQKEEIETQRDEVVAVNEALEKNKRELEFTLENLKLTQSQLIQSEKMACVGILTAGIAHELNNPINYVSNNVSPLLRDVNDVFTIIKKYEEIVKSNKLESTFGEVDELKNKMDFSFLIKEIVHLLEGIEEGANRSGQIVKGLRSFSRLDEENWQHYDVHEGIDSTLILLHNKIKDRIKVRKEYGDLMEIECFPSKINQVIMNVLSNSIQAIDGNGEIFIQTVSSGIGIKIIIKDNGKGMTPEVKKHIFEPFFTTKEVGQGTGLGLSISYGIIEQHQGNIDVISEPGKGTEFIISLPITQEGSV